ncbi:glycosyl transferase family protein [Mycobacteroides abscessus subsp. abscessus]|nr:glycosyl transferase family protein [Mycobacteroides abscessus subsp. abscessus]
MIGVDEVAPTWDGAIWVGEAERADLVAGPLELEGAAEFGKARILVWNELQSMGFIEVPIDDGVLDAADLAAAMEQLAAPPERLAATELPAVTVAVCTRDRPDLLHEVLVSLSDLDYPEYEILVVDNNPTSLITPSVVEKFADARIRLISAAGQGLSIARNVALQHARYDAIAFTDDDVVVEKSWLRNLMYGFARDGRVACVCGMVPSAELLTPAQSYFDQRVGWARTCEPALFDLKNPPADDPLFPFRVADYGTGANFAVRKDVVIGLGGFDEGMGVGSPTAGGEDIDMFLRVLLGGHVLVREPSAVVWHRHRRTTQDLEHQIRNYGLGLGAWLTKLALNPRTAAMALRRVLPGLRHLRSVTMVEQSEVKAESALGNLGRIELRAILAGPYALLRARLEGRSGKPIKAPRNRLSGMFDYRRGQNWGDPGNTIEAGRLTVIAALLGLLGLLTAIETLPSTLRLILLGLFVLVAPGSFILSWYTAKLPVYASISLIPAVSLAVCMLGTTIPLMAGYFDPRIILFGLAGLCVLGGVLRCGILARRAAKQL